MSHRKLGACADGKKTLSLPGSQWSPRQAAEPGSEGDFRQANQVVGAVASGTISIQRKVNYECCAVGACFQMALLRQRTAQGSNAAEIEKKIKR